MPLMATKSKKAFLAQGQSQDHRVMHLGVKTNSYTKFQVNISKDAREKSRKPKFDGQTDGQTDGEQTKGEFMR